MAEQQAAARGRVATFLGVTSIAMVATATIVLIASRGDPFPPTTWFPRGANLPQVAVVTVMGWILARQRPSNPIGWLFVGSGWVLAAQALALETAVVAHANGADGAGRWLALVVEAAWPTMIVAIVYAMTRFPGDDRAGSDRLGTALAATAWVTVTGAELLLAGPFQNFGWYDNPLGLVDGDAVAVVESLAFPPLLALLALTVVRLVRRYRASRGVHRQQFRWVAWSTVPLLVALPLAAVTLDAEAVSATDPVVLGVNVGLVLIPIGIGVAALRYRLYDLDRLLSRTLAWALLTAVVIGVWAAVALLPSALLSSGETNQLLVAGATVVAAAAFNPLRLRLQDLVDRRLYRERYDARREVEVLGARLADEVDRTTVVRHVVATLDRTLAPRTAAIWTPGEEATR